MIAPSYIASIVAVLMGLQQFFGLEFTNDQWTSSIVVISGLVVAIRQVITGRSTIVGSRPK